MADEERYDDTYPTAESLGIDHVRDTDYSNDPEEVLRVHFPKDDDQMLPEVIEDYRWAIRIGRCPKCLKGNDPDDMSLYYCGDGQRINRMKQQWGYEGPDTSSAHQPMYCQIPGEHFHLICARCSYAWVNDDMPTKRRR